MMTTRNAGAQVQLVAEYETGIEYAGADIPVEPDGCFAKLASVQACAQRCRTTPGCNLFGYLPVENSGGW
jgi:hypothetical protein